MIPVALPPRVAGDGLQDPCLYSVKYSTLYVLPGYYKRSDVASQEVTYWSPSLEYTWEVEYSYLLQFEG